MGKEFLKVGPISCSIQANPPYKEMRNGKTDFFTMASEKPRLDPSITTTPLETGNFIFEADAANFSVRVNQVGAEILQNCTGKKSIGKIAIDISEKYDYEDEEFTEQVKTFLNVFRTYSLL